MAVQSSSRVSHNGVVMPTGVVAGTKPADGLGASE